MTIESLSLQMVNLGMFSRQRDAIVAINRLIKKHGIQLDKGRIPMVDVAGIFEVLR